MGNYASQTGNPELVVTVQPYNDNKARKTIVLTETTVDCLRNKIIEAFGEDQDAALHIYYRILRKSVNDESRYLLSRNANLVDIFNEVETLLEKQKQLLFEYNSLFVVAISSKHSAQPDVVVELEKADIMAELKEMIVEHFGVGSNVRIYYQNSETDAKTIIKNEKSLKLGLINSGHVFFEPLETKTIPDEIKRSTSAAISTLTQRDAKSLKASGVFISYNWSTKPNVNAVVDKLQALKPDLPIWRDTEKMESDIYDSMGSGISSCQVVVACFSLGYLQSRNCMKELKFAEDLHKAIIPVYFFEDGDNIEDFKTKYSAAFLIIAGKLYIDFKRWDALDSNWEVAFDNFVKEVDCALNKVAPSAVVALKSPLDVWLLPESFDADLDAYALEYVPGTRLWIVPALEAWTRTKERVIYLNGGAGTGKSLIVYSLTKNLPGNFVIGALFICRYNNVRKSDPIVLVSTIVSSLCLSLGGAYKQYVEAEMEEDHARVKDKKQSLLKTPLEAFKVLVVDGLKKLSDPEWKTKTLLIVIDALDELKKDTRHSVLKILTTLCPKLPGFVKIVTTGRPERDIYYALKELSPFVLSPGNNNNTADLKVFVKYRLQALWGVILQGTDAEKCCEALVKKAEGLFIYARNVCEYIKKQNLDPKQALFDIQALTSGSDGVYKAIIERELQTNRAERLAQFKHVFAVLFTAQRPLTLTSLANIGGLDIRDVESVVSEFRSILKIEHGGVVSAIHKSVKDFFTDFTRCGGELFIHTVDASLAVCCLQILIASLSRNMAHLDPAEFYSKDELVQLTVLNEDLLYAVLFWASHFTLGFPNASVDDQQAIIKLLYQFCTKTLPYYLEALLLLSKLNDVFPMVQSVSDVLSGFTHMEEVKTVLSLLNDLKFVAYNFRTQLLVSPLQVYNHALIAVPQETVYYRLYQNLATARITIGAKEKWGPFTVVGHSHSVYSVAYSPDSKTVVSGSYDNTVKLWSVETGECVKTLVGHSSAVNSVAFSPEGKTVVSGSGTYSSSDKTVKLWSVETGELCKTLKGHSGAVISVAFSPDSKTVVSGSADKTVKLWSVETGECVQTFVGHSEGVYSVGYSSDGKTVVSGSRDNTVKLWSVETGELFKTLVGHSDYVRSVAFSPDSKTVVSGSSDNTVKLWSVETGELCKTLVGHSGVVLSVAFSPDSKTVVSGSAGDTVKFWSVETGELCQTLEEHSYGLNSVAFSPDSKTVVCGSADRTVKLWSVETGELFKTLVGHSDYVRSVAFSPDSKTVVSGSSDNTVKLLSVETGKLSKTFDRHSGVVLSVAFSPDSKTVVSGSVDNTVKLWSVETGGLCKTLVGHSSRVTSVAISPDSKTVVSGSHDKTVKLWSVKTGECVKTCVGHSEFVGFVAFSPDSKTVVFGSGTYSSIDKTVKLWSVETGEVCKTLEGHSGAVISVAFSPDSKTVASGSDDGTAKLWSAETGECVKTLEHASWVSSVAFSPDSKTVVSGSHDGTAKLWSVETGECLETRHWDGSELRGTIFSSGLTVQDGWVCSGRTLLFFPGEKIDGFSESSVSWSMANNVVCLTLKN